MFRLLDKNDKENIIRIQGVQRSNAVVASIMFQNYDRDTSNTYNMAAISCFDYAADNTNNGVGDIIFRTNPDGGSNVIERLRVHHDGVVTIGSNISYNAKLNVDGDIAANGVSLSREVKANTITTYSNLSSSSINTTSLGLSKIIFSGNSPHVNPVSFSSVKSSDNTTFISVETTTLSNDGNIRFFNANVESMRITNATNVGISTSNPTEKLEIVGNLKVSSNIYTFGSVGVGNSNPLSSLAISGNASIGQTYQGYAAPSNGLVVQGNVGVGTHSPRSELDVNGTIMGKCGTLGPMIMLIPPFAYADVQANDRLILDNTLEAGNICNSNNQSLFSGSTFLSQDLSGENMSWTQARMIFRGMALSTQSNVTTQMIVQDYTPNRVPQYSNITDEFNIVTSNTEFGYTTNATPWFFQSAVNVRHLAILLTQSNDVNVTYRFGSVYMQFK